MKLRTGYLISGAVTGVIILLSFIWTLPDGRLHIVYCNVGQGDAAYIRFPDGRDMVVDGGPDDSILQCLGRHMSFWDRHIDMVALTHPQKDHMKGLISVLNRFRVDYFLQSDSEYPDELMNLVRKKNSSVRRVAQNDRIQIGATSLLFLWPSMTTSSDLNDNSLVFDMRYGSFDAVFTGDARLFEQLQNLKYPVEILKVPHHGSKTGMTQDYIGLLKPEVAVISVGKNSYGHPAKEIVDMLQSVNSRVLRTDIYGDVEVVSDGKTWTVQTEKK